MSRASLRPGMAMLLSSAQWGVSENITWDFQEVTWKGEMCTFLFISPFLQPTFLNEGTMTRAQATNVHSENCALGMGQNELEEA